MNIIDDPFYVTGPATISFSGGRTSAYMLWRILQAHGGTLPDDVVVTFANTGKEREETLRFVHECGTRWGVRIRWIEYRRGKKPGFEEVEFNSASRSGEPFAALIKAKSALPNWQARWCTGFLKVGAMTAFLKTLGWTPGEYSEVIGLRADELSRIAKMVGRNAVDGRKCLAPLWKAGIDKAAVMAFWAAQEFDLGLKPGEGNCDLCFLKGRGLRKQLIRDNPGIADWWAEQEITTGAWFDKRDRYAALAVEVGSQPDMFADPSEDFDAECGLICVTAEDSMEQP